MLWCNAYALHCLIGASLRLPGFLLRTDLWHPVRIPASPRTGNTDVYITEGGEADRAARDSRWFPHPADCKPEIDGGVS
jgi:hypothetical protein